MSDLVIKAEGLGKKYLIGHQHKKNAPTLLVFTPFFVSLQHADLQPFFHRNRGASSEKSLRPFDGEAVKSSIKNQFSYSSTNHARTLGYSHNP
jgi:hypothetical protein